MKKLPRYDIFISYRRDGGDMTALYLYERLSRMGYRVCYDLESFLGGRWDDQILVNVRSCRDVVAVLNPGALDRCLDWEKANPDSDAADENDWMRRELACALHEKKNVVPVLLRDFEFPPADGLPRDIRTLPFQNGIKASTEHYKDTFTRLLTRLTAKPAWYRRRSVIASAVAAGIALAALLAVGAPKFLSPHARPYPSTREETQVVNEVMKNVSDLATAYQCAAKARVEFIGEALLSPDDPSVAASGAILLRKQLNDALDILAHARPSEEAVGRLLRTPLDVSVYRALFDASEFEIKDDLKTLPVTIPSYTRKDNPLPPKDKRECLEKNLKWAELQAQFFALGVIELLRPVSPDVLGDFKKQATTYTAIPRLSQPWPADKESLDIEQEAVIQQLEEIKGQLETIVGNQNMDYSSDRRKFESVLQESGATPEQVSGILGEIETQAAKKTEEIWNAKPSE